MFDHRGLAYGTTWALAVLDQWVYRYPIAFGRSLALGEQRIAFRPVREQVAHHAPNRPGLRPER